MYNMLNFYPLLYIDSQHNLLGTGILYYLSSKKTYFSPGVTKMAPHKEAMTKSLKIIQNKKLQNQAVKTNEFIYISIVVYHMFKSKST